MPRRQLSFEIHGRVQQVFFRKCTQERANQLGIVGWCENTAQKTVKGQIEGTPEQLEAMKQWLSNEGSPQSRIERASFSEVHDITSF
ncbi:unnamed protein product, partial [Chrysoparadoxa australica]